MPAALSPKRFFEEVLDAPFANHRWSWGSADMKRSRVFLRVYEEQWRDQPSSGDVQVQSAAWADSARGFNERNRHLALIEAGGVRAWAVRCTHDRERTEQAGRMVGVEPTGLFEITGIRWEGTQAFARIGREASFAEASGPGPAFSRLAADMEEVSATEEDALVQARIGQGRFRDLLLRRWDERCCVTGIRTGAALRASHVVPWHESTDEQRLDPDNGLLLVANLDALFDARLIGFDDAGSLRCSKLLSADERASFGLNGARLREEPTPAQRIFLRRHRAAMRE